MVPDVYVLFLKTICNLLKYYPFMVGNCANLHLQAMFCTILNIGFTS